MKILRRCTDVALFPANLEVSEKNCKDNSHKARDQQMTESLAYGFRPLATQNLK